MVNTVGTYTALGTTGTAIVVTDPDDDNSTAQPIGFTFVYNGQSFTQFVLNTNGALKLGSTPPSDDLDYFPESTDPADQNMLFPLFQDLVAASATTSFRVATTGAAPNRVCTVEWSGMREFDSPAQLTNGSFQVKLYETTNQIEFVYGPATPGTGASAEALAAIGIKGSGPATGQVILGTKAETAAWSTTAWQNSNYTTVGFAYNKTTLADPGRTFRFTPASCAPPSAVTFSGTTGTATTVSFTGPANSTGYTIIYGAAGFNPATAGAGTSVNTTASPYTITGLAAGSSYDVYIRANCGATDQSPLSGPFTITTSCASSTAVAVFPYTQNFDGVTSGTLPCGITVLDVNADNNPWINRSTVPTQGGQSPISSSNPNAMVYFWNTNGTTAADDWFFTPELILRTGFRYQLTFKYRSSGNYPERLEVKYGNAPTVAAQTTTLWTNANVNNAAYATTGAAGVPAVSVIAPPSNGPYYIGFHAYSTADQFFLAVDDLQITATAITGTSAALDRAVSVFPNPSAGRFTLDVRGANAKNGLQVEVVNMLGQRVHTATVRDNFESQLDLSHLANGMYTLKVKSGNDYSIRNLSVQK
ncbi:hypothetical protein GCM10023186_37270 [Hymenobacter koreensis]|uniref:Fibronectin type-III domain-containing protein n=1 Tax=Hymenobacter koreensis TaxID=1084523 RepID=A0ABP8JF29_9BACT